DGFVQLVGSHLRMLQSHGCEADKAVRIGFAPTTKFLVLNFDDLPRKITIGLVPPAPLMAQHLNIDPLLVHELNPLRPENQGLRTVEIVRNIWLELCAFDDVQFFRKYKVTMDVDNFDAFFAKRYLPTFLWYRLNDK